MQIIADQLGYRPEDKKSVVFSGEKPDVYRVVDFTNGQTVYEGREFRKVESRASRETDYIGDFSDWKETGVYRIVTDNQESYPFYIGEDVYGQVTNALLKFFYLQRCGMELTAEYAGEFAHAKCHSGIATVYGTDKKIDVSGGWHDAGDYGRYIVAAAVTVADLLMAYENRPAMFQESLNIPESGSNMPDLLSEVRYELEWMLKMQEEKTGEVYHKVTCFGFPGFVRPEEETEPLLVFEPSVTATATFAAAMAMAERFYKPYDEEFGKRCMDAAVRAYDALVKMDMPGGFHNPEGVITGEYGDDVDTDERYWAAAELFAATGQSRYLEDFKALAQKPVRMGYGWKEVGSYGNRAYLDARFPKDEALAEKIRQDMVALADQLLENSRTDGYEVSLGDHYAWGSNMDVANNGLHLYDAYRITGDNAYLETAKEQVHYLFGKNPMNLCYVTGFGTKSPVHPHHRPSEALKKPMEGMLIGGPDSGLHDETAARLLQGVAPAKCHVDELESYSTNEITIYWNAPLITLLSLQ